MNWLTGDSKKWLHNHRKLACKIHVSGDSVKGQWLCVLNESSTETKAQNLSSGTERMLKVLVESFCYQKLKLQSFISSEKAVCFPFFIYILAFFSTMNVYFLLQCPVIYFILFALSSQCQAFCLSAANNLAVVCSSNKWKLTDLGVIHLR